MKREAICPVCKQMIRTNRKGVLSRHVGSGGAPCRGGQM